MTKGNLPARRRKDLLRKREKVPRGHSTGRQHRRQSPEQERISRFRIKANKDLESLLLKTRVDINGLSAQQKAIIGRMSGSGIEGINILNDLFMVRHFEKNPMPLQKIYEAVFVGAVAEFGNGQHYKSLKLLGDISLDWLTEPKIKNPGEIGRRAFVLSRAIASSWAAEHASEYAGLDVSRTRFKAKGTKLIGVYDVSWSAEAVKTLAEVGTLFDLVAIRKLETSSREGGMEIYCANARNRIITREALQMALRNAGKDLSRLGVKTGLNRIQAAQRFEVLFQKLGLGNIIQMLRGFKAVAGLPVNWVSADIQAREINKIVEQKLNQVIELGPVGTHDIGGAEVGACERFLLGQNMIVPVGGEKMLPGTAIGEKKPRFHTEKYVLTQKGKTVVKTLCAQIGTISIRMK